MRCVIAGGGTGGHLFPGMAIAEAFVEREKGNEVLFIGTERGIEARVLAGGRFPLRMIQARPIKGRSFWGKVKALWSFPMAVSEASSILKEFQPQVVLGVGGYASGPDSSGRLPSRNEEGHPRAECDAGNDQSNSKVVQPTDLRLLRRDEEILPGREDHCDRKPDQEGDLCQLKEGKGERKKEESIYPSHLWRKCRSPSDQ